MLDHAPPAPARRIELSVDGLRCAGCMATVERAVAALPGVASARVNLSQKRLGVTAAPDGPDADAIAATLAALGYPARPVDRAALATLDRDAEGRALLLRIGVAGFAAMNVMLLSVAVWSGADGATARLLLWVSMVIAVPAVGWAARPFFDSAARALAARRLNMDVPIALAILLALGVSVHATLSGRGEGWYEASTGLTFFLLVGRYLDHRARRAARSAAVELGGLRARTATVIDPDGTRRTVPADTLTPGQTVEVLPGQRIPADGVVSDGRGDIDRALVTGESAPEPAGPGTGLHAGMLNLTGRLALRVTRTGDDTLLAELQRLIEAAESADGRTLRLADRAARAYAPGVHAIAAAATLGWLLAGAGWHQAILVGAATMIITCPCALGLAIPTVQAVAGARLFRAGIFLKDGAALEELARADTIVFDKTGTLTTGQPRLVEAPDPADPAWGHAAALAAASRHPLAQALLAAAERLGVRAAGLEAVAEHPGAGIEGTLAGRTLRLGRADWLGLDDPDGGTAVWLARPGAAPCVFRFRDSLRPDAAATVAALKATGRRVLMLSGDAEPAVRAIAAAAGIEEVHARITPAGKQALIASLRAGGARVAMIGDGLNDAPALAAADVSLAPASAAEIAEAGAQVVWRGAGLGPVLTAFRVAATARRRMLQNLWLAGGYNAVAIPLAVLGHATPVIAAVAMSASSLVVTLNALRLRNAA